MKITRSRKLYSEHKEEVAQLKKEVAEARTVIDSIVTLCKRYFEDPDYQIIRQISAKFDRLKGESLDIKDLYEEILKIDPEYQDRLVSVNRLNNNLVFYYTLSVVYLSLPIVFAFSQERQKDVLVNNYESVIRIALMVALSTRNRTGAEEDVSVDPVSVQRAKKEVDALLNSIQQKSYLQHLFAMFADLFDESRDISIKNFGIYKKIVLGILGEQMERGLRSNLTFQKVMADEEIKETIKNSTKKGLIKEIIDYIVDMRRELVEKTPETQKVLSFRLLRR